MSKSMENILDKACLEKMLNSYLNFFFNLKKNSYPVVMMSTENLLHFRDEMALQSFCADLSRPSQTKGLWKGR